MNGKRDYSRDPVQESLEATGFDVYCADSMVAARLHITAWVRQHDITTLVGWPEHIVGIRGLSETLQEMNIRWLTPSGMEQWWTALKGGKVGEYVGLVRASGYILDRGLLAFTWNKERPLSLLILPKRLLVVLFSGDVFASWDKWLGEKAADSFARPPAHFLLSSTGRARFVAGESVPFWDRVPNTHIVLVQQSSHGEASE